MTRIRRTLGIALLLASTVSAIALAQVTGPSQMDQCDQETFTITLENTSPSQSACDIVITATPPATGFSYVSGTGTVTLHDPPGPISADPTGNAWDIDAIVGSDYELPPGEQISVAFDLTTDCTAESGNIEVQIDYEDCSTAQPYQELDSLSIEVLPGALIITKTPSVQDASVGDQVVWTITVESSGLGTIWNVEVTDVLGGGLAYVSDTGGGSNAGQTTTWSLGDIAAGGASSFDLTAEVIGCSDLINTADARWGCDPGEICYDTEDPGPCGCPSATASLNLIVDNPALSFTPPNVTVAYCTDETAGLVQITNSGAGTARNVELCCDIAHLQVDPARLPPGTTYSAGCFQVPDIDPGTTFDLTFFVLHADVDWCNGPLPSGDNVFQLTYTNDCDVPFVAYPQFSTLSSESGPSLDVTKSSPAPLQLGEVASYDIAVDYGGDLGCYSGSPGPVTIVDDYPNGFTVVDADGGIDDGDTITWTYDPAVDPPFDRTVQLQVPNDCAYCVGLAGTIPNTVTATTTDCCGCTLTGTATAQTTILCEGLDDTEFFRSTFADFVPPSPLLRCDPSVSNTFRAEHTYEFYNEATLDDLFLDEFVYFVEGNSEIQYAGSLAVTGASVDSVTDGTPGGRLEIRLADDASPVTNRTITFAYDLTYVDLDDPNEPPCTDDSVDVDAGIELDPGATSIGFCSRMYGDETDPPTMAVEAPAMSVSIDGIPTIQESCATYDVTVTLTKTSNLADPYDVRLVLTNAGGSVIDLSGAVCSGVTTTDGTGCATPIEGTDTYEWRFADGFVAGDTASIGPIQVTVPCSGPLADLSVVATFDDLCRDDATYGDACSTTASDAASLSLSADVYARKSPEILFATERYVTWSLVVHNTGNGTAYNVWVDDVLGSGLIFDQGNTLPDGATISANLDHTGAPINGASFLFDEVAPGELKTITFAAELVGCSDLTNDIEVSWGCGGSDCRTPRTDSSSVLVPGAQLVATSFSPTPIDVCTASYVNLTVKSTGIGTAYDIVVDVTLPDGIAYDGNPRFSLDGGSNWLTAGISDPTQAGEILTWTSAELPELSESPPGEEIDIRFDVAAGCDFDGGNLTLQARYENPCGDTFDSNVGSFSISARIPDVSVSMAQNPDDAIPCGANATWTITVQNDGPVPAPYVRVVSTLDAGWSYVSSTGGGTNVGQVTTWVINDLGPGASTDLTITADSAAGGGDCGDLNHQVQSFWACDETDVQCLSSAADTVSIVGARTPPVTVGATLAPDSVEVCTDTTTFTLTVTNGSATAPASTVDARVTLPSGLSYVLGTTEIDCGSGFVPGPDPNIDGQQITWYDTAVDGGASDACTTLAAGGQIRIRFDVDSSCYFDAGSANSRIFYYDCCGVTQTQRSRNDSIGSDQPNLTITKTPDVSDAVCGDTVTWTIQVTNTSPDAIAEVVRIEDFLGANLSYVSATGGAVAITGGQILHPTPPAHGEAYVWELGPLAPLASTSVTISAQLTAPADCTNALRTNTAAVTWACGTPDGDPTTADYDCESDEWDSASNRVPMPNLEIDSSDIAPTFACAGDGITPGSGEIELVVRNTGDGPIPLGSDFAITVTETTTGYSVTDTFTSLGGTLPLAAGASDALVFPWAVTCTSCEYTVNVTLDTLDDICECDETDNAATKNETISLPDLVVDSTGLSVICSGDGEIRIQGPVTLRNDGCGDPLAGTVRVRFRLYDAANCAGSEIDTFTVNLAGLSIAADGGTEERTIDVTRTLDTCDTCELSIRLEADDNDAICECDGTNNALCAGTFPIAFPDLTITDIDFSQVTCASDAIAGTVRVTVLNDGCGTAGPFDLQLETDGCLTFSDEPVAGLTASASTTVDFTVSGTWADCTDCACTFTATVDPAGDICECDGTNNGRSEPFTSTMPDLEISGAVASIGCSVDGQATLDADATVRNTGCADVTASYDLRVTIYADANCAGAVVDTWAETVNDNVSASGSTVISLTTHVLSQGLCADDCAYSARFEVDANDDICECDGTDNAFCLASIPSELPDLVVTEVDPSVDCRTGTASVTATVENVGCGDATGVVLRLTSPGCSLSIDSAPIDLASGASQDIVFTYAPDCDDDSWNCTYTVTADPDAAICECAGANGLTRDGYPGIGSIGDRVWFDADGDGVQDGGEDGIPNVTLILEGDLDGDGTIDYVAETTTDANGEYLFDSLPAGDYTVTVDDTTLPDGLAQTYDYDGLGTPHASGYSLAENEHNREQDFGYRGTGSIGDYVWFDSNGDGVQDPSESGIENVTVMLEGDVDGDGVDEILTTTTDADGLYLFEYLPAGPYTITVDDTTLPDGLAQTYDYDGLGSPHTSDYTLGAGEHNREQDFGYATPALSVDKVIVEIRRGGSSIGNIVGPVEPGDRIVYEFVIENVGPVPAYDVGFDDTLPPGVEIAAGNPGTYAVSAPTASGSLGLSGGETSFIAPIGAAVNAGEALTASFTAVVTSGVSQDDDLTNTAHAFGDREDGTPIPPENTALGDTSDTDLEDPDADDTGIVTVSVRRPALSVDKTITDIVRPGVGSVGIAGPVEPGDVVFYRFVIRNVGGGTAYDVEFTDTLPTGLVTETDPPGDSGDYTVTQPAASGSLGLADGVATFATSIDAEIAAGEALTANFAAEVTSGIVQGVDLVNTAEATGEDGFGTEIPDENPDTGDTADDDEEDPDADDTGIAIIPAEEPALSVDKVVTDIVRRGASLGSIAGPVEPGDVILYQYTIRNVGLGTAYAVDFTDALPTGLVTETDAPGIPGSYDVSDPSVSDAPLAGLTDGASTFTTSIDATISGGEQLVAEYAVLVTSDVRQGIDLINVATTVGVDGAGNPIPGENVDLGDTTDDDDEDPDADDTGITVIAPVVPALTIDKRVIDVHRGGASVGVVDPVLYDDVIVYRTTIRNVGLGTAYDVEFTDTLPAGLAIETGAAPGAGSYVVTDPAASGTLGLSDGATSFTTAIYATIGGGETLTAIYAAVVTAAAPPALELINVAETTGEDGTGTEIPDENADVGDTSDDDEEDPDADDTGIASVRVGAPALVTRKAIAEIRRQGLAVGGDVVEPGDIVTYEVGVTNVGDGPALRVDLFDELPPGFLYGGNTDATWPSGSSTADPLGVPGPLLSWPLDASLDADEELVLRFDAFVTSNVAQGATYTNTITATGEDGAGEEIPPDNSGLVPEDDDPDDTSDVPLIGAVPALVTDKSIVDVERDGRSLGAVGTIEESDVVTYALRITNVGLGTAYDVDVRDLLPEPFEYIAGTALGDWPFRAGSFTADPSGAPGPTLLWDTDATLAHDESIDLTFDASIAGPVAAGTAYTNVLIASGRDGAENDIPPNNADDVPEDDDPDDRDDVSIIAVEVVPALVTTKRVLDVFRDGVSTRDRTIEEGDVVLFELSVRNVGPATAYEVGIDDRLPLELEYVPGTTRSAWPRGSASSDPRLDAAGWIWDLGATLASGERLILTFDARVLGPLLDGAVYTNRMHAFGKDAAGDRIPEDQRNVVPSDIDPDDASDVGLPARSSYIEGEGGLIAVPLLRKSAEILGAGACEGWTADVDRVWFQTDIAMFAAAEFERLATVPSDGARLPETLLPTWLRTVQVQGVAAARDNLLQVDGLSSLGVPLSDGPRIARLAERSGVPAEKALATRLDELAARAGLGADERPADERWIVLEHAEGEPIYVTSTDGPRGPFGDWAIVDERIVGSSLGMGLLEQASAAGPLVASDEPLDRYLGWLLVEIIANKLIALDETLTIRDGVPYVPHAFAVAAQAGYDVADEDSYLFDQLSLLWGLARTVELVDGMASDAIDADAALWTEIRGTSVRLLGEVLDAIEARHVSAGGDLLDRSSGDRVTTVNLGLLLAALQAARGAAPADDRIDTLFDRALVQLAARQAETDLFAAAASGDPASFVELRSQLAGIRGLLIAYEATGDARYATHAQEAFDALDDALWIDRAGIGLYASARFDGTRTTCYTPLDVGLVVGALRELAAVSTTERRGLVLSRLTGFVRSIVDEAALQLSNALPSDADVTFGVGRYEIAPIEADLRTVRVAPVFQQRLCLEEIETDEACGGWDAIDHEPWYRTDISMYAAHVLHDRLLGFEDVADANLVAVVFHAGLGVPLGDISVLRDAVDALDDGLEPIALPFAAGSPRLATANDLAWPESTFDPRVVASAVGMTLLREAQEVRQALDESAIDPERDREIRLLMGAIAETIDALLDVRKEGPGGVAYVPHASTWNVSTGRLVPMETESGLFDQAALLWGLSEVRALLADPRSAVLLEPWSRDAAELAGRATDLIGTVLLTLEIAHLDPNARVLVDKSDPSDNATWALGSHVSTVSLGVAASALDASIDVLGPASSDGRRTVSLLSSIADFVRTDAWRGVGEVDEVVDLDRMSDGACESETLSGQLGALRVLLAAERWLDLGAETVAEAVRAIDSRFWDPDLLLYRSEPERIEWCVTPLDLGLAVDALDRGAAALPSTEAAALRTRLARHVDRILDAVRLQLPAEREDAAFFAPVFDRRVCLRPIDLLGATGWARPGDVIRYAIAAENGSDETFIDLVLEDMLPEGVTPIATQPTGEIAGRAVTWTFDELLPSEERTWAILARVGDTVALGETLLNCTVLSYSNTDGEPQPPREACAATLIQTLDEGRESLLIDLPLWYVTDEAMRLAVALDDLSRLAPSWEQSGSAHELAAANLGALLGASSLGVPLEAAPRLSSPGSAEALSALLDAFAMRSGLPKAPSGLRPILLPFEAGTPVVESDTGFVEKSETITPAAVGWTLAAEAAFLDDGAVAGTRLNVYLGDLVAFTVDNQIEWLARFLLPSDGAHAYLPHGLHATSTGNDTVYGISDPRSTAYDQASLLIGLVRVAEADALDRRTKLLAQQMASVVFDQLERHWDIASGILLDELYADIASEPAAWDDAAVVVRSLSASGSILPRGTDRAKALLEALSAAALDRGPIAQRTAEAGRLTVLAVAAQVLGHEEARIGFTDGWFAYVAGGDVERSALRARPDWSFAPGEIATRIALLSEVSRAIPAEMPTALAAATVHVDTDILGAHVQLLDPARLWLDHAHTPCAGLAAVFAHLRGPIPDLP